jgi:hypothetical protein
MQNEKDDADDQQYVEQAGGYMKCEKPKQPTNDQNCSNESQHDFFSLFPRAKLSPLYIRAQRPSPSTAEFLAELTCASQKEMSVHLETPHAQPLLLTARLAGPIQILRSRTIHPRRRGLDPASRTGL